MLKKRFISGGITLIMSVLAYFFAATPGEQIQANIIAPEIIKDEIPIIEEVIPETVIDFNNDGITDYLDISIFEVNFNEAIQKEIYIKSIDLNDDGVVDEKDMLLIQERANLSNNKNISEDDLPKSSENL